MLGTVLADGSYEVVGATHTSALGYGLAIKHRPHVLCIAREQVEDGNDVVEQLRRELPKTLIFLVSGSLDAPAVQAALARGVKCLLGLVPGLLQRGRKQLGVGDHRYVLLETPMNGCQ